MCQAEAETQRGKDSVAETLNAAHRVMMRGAYLQGVPPKLLADSCRGAYYSLTSCKSFMYPNWKLNILAMP